MRMGYKRDVEDYFADKEHVSQSQLKMILKGIPPEKEESKLYYAEKGHFVIGSAVDTWITQGIFAFEKQFHVSTISKPSDTIMSIIKMTFDKLSNEIDDIGGIDFELCKEDIQWACNQNDYYTKRHKSNVEIDTRIATILEHQDYWDELVKSKDKTLLSAEEYAIVQKVVYSIKNGNDTKHLFYEGELVDIMFQVPIYFEHNGLKCKALLDMIRVDHADEVIYPFDFKTTGDYVNNFQSSFKKFRYDFQAAFYSLALKSIPEYKDYRIAPFAFIVESTILQNPTVYSTTKEILNDAYFGRKIEVNGEVIKDIPGIKQAIEAWKWYEVNGFDKNPKKQNGRIILDRL